MLGWEFPPFISGGLGTACHGLTRAMDAKGHRVKFVLPKAIDASLATHVDLISPASEPDSPEATDAPSDKAVAPEPDKDAPTSSTPDAPPAAPSPDAIEEKQPGQVYRMEGFERTEFVAIPSEVTSPYDSGESQAMYEPRIIEGKRVFVDRSGNVVDEETARKGTGGHGAQPETPSPGHASMPHGAEPTSESHPASGDDYSGDVLSVSGRYAELVLKMCSHMEFDVIHAHDWMTYPAGLAIARKTGKPLVAHIHSTEFDRSGQHVNERIYDIERRGMHGAVRVIAVSQLTAKIVEHKYGVLPETIRVVYNGVEHGDTMEQLPEAVTSKDKIVLFLGRITMQKGPEYFVKAAKRVLEKCENVKFIVAGNGDLARQMIEQAAELGIGHKVLFTGFLRGNDVKRVFRMADCYVMPSVSEPFGIAPLEAMSNDVPVIISKQSGVSEVLRHALKVDFWDVDEMANKIIAVLKHPPLSQMLREHSHLDLHKLTWEGAAEKCLTVYREAIEAVEGVDEPIVTKA